MNARGKSRNKLHQLAKKYAIKGKHRKASKIHRFNNGDVSRADTNAAKNTKQRADGTEISRFTPHRVVKRILLGRLLATGGVSGSKSRNRPSMTSVARRKRTSTKSELPGNFEQTQI